MGRASVSSSNRTRSHSLRPSASFVSRSELTWSSSARGAAWLLPRIFYKGKIFFSVAGRQHTHCRRGKSLVCGCNQGPPVSPPEESVTTCRHHLDQRFSLPQRFPNRRTIHLGNDSWRDWHFCLPSDQRWGLSTKTASVGMNCRELKPNSRRIGLKALSVCMGGTPDHHLRPVICDLLLTNTRLERLMRHGPCP